MCAAQAQGTAGPAGAFDEGNKGAVRQELFNNISSVYDEVRTCQGHLVPVVQKMFLA